MEVNYAGYRHTVLHLLVASVMRFTTDHPLRSVTNLNIKENVNVAYYWSPTSIRLPKLEYLSSSAYHIYYLINAQYSRHSATLTSYPRCYSAVVVS